MSGAVVSPPHNMSDEEKDDCTNVELGGTSTIPCFCLLDGFFQDPETGEKSRVTIPITNLPATLGRSHENEDPHFFGLGRKKALSRKQCRITYRDAEGGTVAWNKSEGKLAYEEPTGQGNHATLLTTDNLPSKGFFVIECLGKNRILVNQNKVEQGQGAPLTSGSSLRISTYTLYFLLPTNNPPLIEHVISLTGEFSSTPSKKRKLPAAAPEAAPSSSSPAAAAPTAASAAAPGAKRAKASLQEDIDSLPVETLLERMTEAIDNDLWERKHQLIGAAVALHAVRDSARDPAIQTVAVDGGVSRSDMMAWIEESPKYANWNKQMLTKMEPRSFQAAITKSLLKGGFTRTGSSGRYIKWILPPDIPIVAQPSSKPKEAAKGKPKEKVAVKEEPKKEKKKAALQEKKVKSGDGGMDEDKANEDEDGDSEDNEAGGGESEANANDGDDGDEEDEIEDKEDAAEEEEEEEVDDEEEDSKGDEPDDDEDKSKSDAESNADAEDGGDEDQELPEHDKGAGKEEENS